MYIPVSIQSALKLAACLFVLPFVVGAQVRSTPPAIVTRYCSGCHGVDGASQLPYVPRLAGIGAPYLESRFAAYKAAAASPVDEAFSMLVRFRTKSNPLG